jgi:hypothetical protein
MSSVDTVAPLVTSVVGISVQLGPEGALSA